MRFLLRLVAFLAFLVVAAIGVAFVLPSTSHVERSITIDRPASQVYLLLSSFKRFNEWSPWYGRDPQTIYTHSGPAVGVGAKLAWSSQRSDVGEGSQTIVAATPDQSVSIELDFGDFGKPDARFTLTPAGGATRVTWSFDGKHPLEVGRAFVWNVVGRYMGLAMDRMVGPDYENGLRKLKDLVETFPNVDIAGLAPELVDLAPRKIIYVSTSTALEEPEVVVAALKDAFAQVWRFASEHKLTIEGSPVTLTRAFDGTTWTFDAGIGAAWDVMPQDGSVLGRETPAGRAVRVVHTGPIAGLARTAQQLHAWIAVKGWKARDVTMHEYHGDVAAPEVNVVVSVPVD